MNKMATEPMTGTAAEEKPKVRRKVKLAEKKGAMRTFLMLIVPALLIVAGGYYWLTSGKSVSTDDAQIKQDIVSVSAQVNGPIVQVFVKDGAQVKKGEVLFRIDPQPYQVALEQAQAQYAAAQLQTSQLRTQAAGTGADIVGEQANLAIKKNALARQQALLKQGFTTRADYEDALNEVKTAEQKVADAQARAANAHAALAPGEQPQIAQAKAAVDSAKAAGIVGEQADGFLGFVAGGGDPALRSAVAEINAGRAEVYRQAAAKNNVTPAAAGASAFQSVVMGKIKPGEFYKPAGGGWVRK